MSLTFGLGSVAARRVYEVPALYAFVERVQAVLTGDVESFWNCEADFSALLQTSFITDVLNHELTLMTQDGSYFALGASTNTNFTIASTPSWSLSVRLWLAPPPVPRLLSSAEHSFIGVPIEGSSGELVLDDYEQTFYCDENYVQRLSKLLPRGQITINKGETVRRRAGIDVSRLIYTGKPVIAVLFSSALVMSLRWDYDLETLLLRRTVAANVRSSRIEFAAKLLARIGDATSLVQLQALCQHKDHFVRWEALRAIVAIDPHQGLRALKKAVTDPHPHVAAAAAKALPRVKAAVASRHT